MKGRGDGMYGCSYPRIKISPTLGAERCIFCQEGNDCFAMHRGVLLSAAGRCVLRCVLYSVPHGTANKTVNREHRKRTSDERRTDIRWTSVGFRLPSVGRLTSGRCQQKSDGRQPAVRPHPLSDDMRTRCRRRCNDSFAVVHTTPKCGLRLARQAMQTATQ